MDINNLVQQNNELLSYGQDMTMKLLEEKNIKKLFVNKSLISQEQKDLLLGCKETLKIDMLFTESATLKMYGGWLGVKKY